MEECNQRYIPEARLIQRVTEAIQAPEDNHCVRHAERGEEETELARGENQGIQKKNGVEDIQLLGQNDLPTTEQSRQSTRDVVIERIDGKNREDLTVEEKLDQRFRDLEPSCME